MKIHSLVRALFHLSHWFRPSRRPCLPAVSNSDPWWTWRTAASAEVPVDKDRMPTRFIDLWLFSSCHFQKQKLSLASRLKIFPNMVPRCSKMFEAGLRLNTPRMAWFTAQRTKFCSLQGIWSKIFGVAQLSQIVPGASKTIETNN